MKYKIKFLFFILFFLFFQTSLLSAQSNSWENDLGLWSPIHFSLPINKKLKTHFEISPRIQENITHINQLLVRPSVGYQLTDNLSFWQGYGWVTNYIPRFTREERIWQQILHEKEFSKFRLTNRFRLEERFIQDINGAPIRTRYLLRAMFPLEKKKEWFFVTSDELFVNLDSHFEGPQAGIDQNRLFVGLNHKVSDNVNLEGGYQMQYLNRQSSAQDRLNHIILIKMYFDLPQLMKD